MEKLVLRDDYRGYMLVDVRKRRYIEVEKSGAVFLLGRDCVGVACRKEGPERVAAVMAEKARIFTEGTVFKGVYETEGGLDFVFSSPGRGDITFSLYWMADAPACDCKRYLDDISWEEAEEAFDDPHLGAGGFPAIVRYEYTGFLQRFYDKLEAVLAGKRKAKRREVEFQAFREGLKLAYRAYLRAEKRCLPSPLEGLSGKELEALFARARKLGNIKDVRHLHVEMYEEVCMSAVAASSRRRRWEDCLPVPGECAEKIFHDLKMLKVLHDSMMEVNRVLHRAGKDRQRQEEELRGLGMNERMVGKILERDSVNNIGFPSYALFRSLGRIKVAERLLQETMESEEA